MDATLVGIDEAPASALCDVCPRKCVKACRRISDGFPRPCLCCATDPVQINYEEFVKMMMAK